MQDYRVTESISVWVYDRQIKNKRHQRSLSIPTKVRDRNKTRRATFANFIHQIDATIACNVIDLCGYPHISISTVHDNFVTSACCASLMPYLYMLSCLALSDPLYLINRLIY